MSQQAMVPWHLTSEKDRELAAAIAERSVSTEIHLDGKSAAMDVEAFHMLVPLDLQKLLDFEDVHFIHDVAGIRDCLDRDNFRVEHNFLPRCHA